ncbi:MAG: hypothetical protein ACU843_07515 [Gammaproteobacteria bacterium]
MQTSFIHLADSILNGPPNISGRGIVAAGLVLMHVTIARVTIDLHHHLVRESLDLHPFASHFFRFWFWLTTGIITKERVAVQLEEY